MFGNFQKITEHIYCINISWPMKSYREKQNDEKKQKRKNKNNQED